MRRTALLVGSVVVSLALAGCGGGGATEKPAPQQTPAQDTAGSSRTAAAKQTVLADKCSIVKPDQVPSLGADQPPEPRDSNGKPGCQYSHLAAGAAGSWGAFVAVSSDSSYDDEVGKRVAPDKSGDLGGYPYSSFKIGDGCLLYANVADKGFLLVSSQSSSTTPPNVDLCQENEKFAQAAIQNLPNA